MNALVAFGGVLLLGLVFLSSLFALGRPEYKYVGHRMMARWSGSLPFYEFRCGKHGIVENYPQGYRQIMYCPECQREARAREQPTPRRSQA